MASELAVFQQAAVERIVSRLSDPKGSRRFLLADEVGLGKTRVAAGVITALSGKRRSGFTVVYVCSNAEIAEQNRAKLSPDSGRAAVTRLTLLATRSEEIEAQRKKEGTQLFSFTPGTSLKIGGATGIGWERRLLLYLLLRVWGKRVGRAPWREFFRCGSKQEKWTTGSKFSAVRRDFANRIAKSLQRRLKAEWNDCEVRLIDPVNGKPASKPQRLADIIDAQIENYSTNPDRVAQKNRNLVIGALRHCLSRVALQFLQPDLVILDEFQRFKDVLEEEINPNSIVSQLFSRKDQAVLILSATPYKMLTQDHESEDHHTEFINTSKFLYRAKVDEENDPNSKVGRLKLNLEAFKQRLMTTDWFVGTDHEFLKLKTEIENNLKAVMCRTERNRYLEDHKKGVEEIGIDATGAGPTEVEMEHYIRLRKFLLTERIDDWNITDFWKSAPCPLAFMDSHYVLMKRIRSGQSRVPSALVPSGRAIGETAAEHLKIKMLTKNVFGPPDSKLRFLWIKPSYTYYADEFYGDQGPTKHLVFSHWKFVPKAISVLLSNEAEKRLGRRKGRRESVPLRFRRRISFSLFDVCYPSMALADCLSPAEVGIQTGGKLSSRELIERAEKAVRRLLKENGIAEAAEKSAPWWRVVARIESKSRYAQLIREAHNDAGVVGGDGEHDQYRDYGRQYCRWMDDEIESLQISPKAIRRLALIVLHSPAVCLLRSMQSVLLDVGDWEKAHWPVVFDLGINQLRNYFNKRTVQTVIRSNSGRRHNYVLQILNYCGRAHFQAVFDEYSYLLRTALPDNRAGDVPQNFLEQVGCVLGMGIGSPSINALTRRGRIRARPSPQPAHLAVAFGDDVTVDSSEVAGRSRKTAIREAFNSPFWPFVLATTSVGQEGLDFHLYCRDIMHWNLPSNPVDLEQREGRINRYDGLAIRRNIATDHSLAAVGAINGEKQNLWARVFKLLKTDTTGTQRFNHGLYPHWIYQPASGDSPMIRRHLAFHAGSRDIVRYRDLKGALSLYRLVFGQPRQQDIIDALLRKFSGANPTEIGMKLAKYTINLSPIPAGHASQSAKIEAHALAQDLEKLTFVLEKVRLLLETDSKALLDSVKPEVLFLVEVAAANHSSARISMSHRIDAIAALIYFLNPYDDIFDRHDGIGYQDDISFMKQTCSILRAAQENPETVHG
jgi:uncharacterized membrane protein YkvA (DUF1232 family)